MTVVSAGSPRGAWAGLVLGGFSSDSFIRRSTPGAPRRRSGAGMACLRELRGLGARSPPEREDGRRNRPGESARNDRRAQAAGARRGVQGWTQGRRPNTDTALPQFPHRLNGENGVIHPQSRRLEAGERSLLLARGPRPLPVQPRARRGAGNQRGRRAGWRAGGRGGADHAPGRRGGARPAGLGAALSAAGAGGTGAARRVRGRGSGRRPGCARPRRGGTGGTGGLGRCPATCSGTCECAPMGAAAPLPLPLPPPPTAPRS